MAGIINQPNTNSSDSLEQQSANANAQIAFYEQALKEMAEKKRLFPHAEDKYADKWMRIPMNPKDTFGMFGFLLGLFPPAAIFYQLFSNSGGRPIMFALLVVMNIICAGAGYGMGKTLGPCAMNIERYSWPRMIINSSLLGLIWGLIVGGAGGFLFFGIGAFAGMVCASLIAMVAFPVFSILHRWLEHGTQIELKHFLPMAFGITLIIAALILGF
jgi:hypothetical protein